MNAKPGSQGDPEARAGAFPPPARTIYLRDLGIDREEAADLCWRLRTFAEDWQRPEMDVYDVD